MESEKESIALEASGGFEVAAGLLSAGLEDGPRGSVPHAWFRVATLLFLAIRRWSVPRQASHLQIALDAASDCASLQGSP